MPRRELARVLLAEDERDIREIAVLALEAIGGFSVRACASGKEVLAAIDSFQPDIIVLDVMMPTLSGTATLERLNLRPGVPKIPVVFMTARAQRHEVESFLVLGAAGVIAKPFDPMTLADELRAIWRGIPD